MNKYILLMLLCLLIGCRNQGNDVVIKDIDDVYFYLENKKNPEKAQLMARIAFELERENYEEAEKYFIQMESLKKEGILYTADFYYRFKDEKEKGMEKYKKAYENGLKEAATFMGIIEHRNKNIDEAKKWYQIASEIGNTDSQIYLAQILKEEGDKTEAVNLYLKAAELKDYRAINYLLKYYYREKNLKEIKKWVDVVKKSNGLKNYSEADSGRIKEYEKFLKEKE